jgi:predicted acetyltransferase
VYLPVARERSFSVEYFRELAFFHGRAYACKAKEPKRQLRRKVPGSDFWLIDGSDYIGRLSLRHELNERLLQMGGHIISSINTPVVRNAVRTAWPGKENYDATAR